MLEITKRASHEIAEIVRAATSSDRLTHGDRQRIAHNVHEKAGELKMAFHRHGMENKLFQLKVAVDAFANEPLTEQILNSLQSAAASVTLAADRLNRMS